MDSDEFVQVANSVVLAQLNRPLSDLERHVLQESLMGKSYGDMAAGWSPKTLKDAGSKLWQCFSQALEGSVKVSKANFQGALIQLAQNDRYQNHSTPKEPGGVEQGSQATFHSDLGRLADEDALVQNPFGDRGRITNPERFFDREEILRQVFEGLSQGSSQSLVGESQVGKSSLLFMIYLKGRDRFPNHQFVFLDMQCIQNENEFFRALCHELRLETPCRGFELYRKLRKKRCVICLDEIERMVDSNDFSGRERTELRGLSEGMQAPITLVCASRSPLSILFPDSPETTSPLAGIFQQLTVSPFSPDIARAFLQHRLKRTHKNFTPAQIDTLIEESGGHPALLQQYAAELYRQN